VTGLCFSIAGGAEAVADAEQALSAWLTGAGLPEAAAARAALLLEEVALNALRHGGAPRVDIEAQVTAAGIALVFEDTGAPFDPLAGAAAAPDPDRPGGRGLLLIRRLSSGARYARTPDGHNRLELTLNPE
jgi:anti-sigma regulatory factor (Ser/Thr protein kinase)